MQTESISKNAIPLNSRLRSKQEQSIHYNNNVRNVQKQIYK